MPGPLLFSVTFLVAPLAGFVRLPVAILCPNVLQSQQR